jgi:parallel beta-helix repeat protein
MANGTIYIKADGSVEGTDKIFSSNNITYIFTGDVYGSIVIERSNIVVDGMGYVLHGAADGIGIDLSFMNNVTVKNIEIREFEFGIYLNHSTFNSIVKNTLTAIKFEAIRLYESSHNNITANEIAVNNIDGIVLYGSFNNTITRNNITNNYDGIRLYSSSNNTLRENNVAGNSWGIFLAISSNNIVLRNNLTVNTAAIGLKWASNENEISQNSIMQNDYGIDLSNSSNNFIYHNIFVNNTYQTNINNSTNIWDNGYPSGGNYWNDYAGSDSDNDGIGDSPYFIDNDNQDDYPLMGMFYDFELVGFYNKIYHVQVISNSTVSELNLVVWLSSPNEYLQPGQEFLQFYVEGENDTSGFCRITIPKALLNDSYTVLVDWTVVPAHQLDVSNSTHAYLYFTYNHSKHEVIIIPEFPSTVTLPFLMLTNLIATLLLKKKLKNKTQTS